MKIIIVILSLLIILAGILPFLGEDGLGLLPKSIPTSGIAYSTIVIIIGAVSIVYALSNKMVIGLEKMVTITIGLLTVLGGVWPFIKESLIPVIPASGPSYSIVLIIIGILGLVYGFAHLG